MFILFPTFNLCGFLQTILAVVVNPEVVVQASTIIEVFLITSIGSLPPVSKLIELGCE